MNKYQSHKVVQATQIITAVALEGGSIYLECKDLDGTVYPIEVEDDEVRRFSRCVDASDKGFLVQYQDGYRSWSPTDAFVEGYIALSDEAPEGLDFGDALMLAKLGHKLRRRGWNGRDMWIAYTPGSSFSAALAKEGHAAAHRAAEVGEDGLVDLGAHMDMRGADGTITVGWLPSGPDMFAEDWEVCG